MGQVPAWLFILLLPPQSHPSSVCNHYKFFRTRVGFDARGCYTSEIRVATSNLFSELFGDLGRVLVLLVVFFLKKEDYQNQKH